jgi:hypothetical protein
MGLSMVFFKEAGLWVMAEGGETGAGASADEVIDGD